MSAQPPPDPAGKPEEKKGLGKYVTRVRSILRGGGGGERRTGGEPSRRLSLFSTRGAGGPSASAGPSAPAAAAPAAPAAPQRLSAEQDLARRLAERFNIDLEPEDWRLIPAAERVEKPIRMRIHRTCHRCNTPFGANKVCVSCEHPRCAECPRYPPKKVSKKGKQPEGESAGPKDVNRAGNYTITGEGLETLEAIRNKYRLTIPSKTGGQELVRKKPLQRIRRNCHQCHTLFQPSTKTCASCGHIRCADCPRDPPKKYKYPYGYPGDAESETPRYTCHSCQTVFPVDESVCGNCGHEKCDECAKAEVGKKNPETHPDVIRRIEQKLAAMRMPSSDPAPLPASAQRPPASEAQPPPTDLPPPPG